MDHWGDPWADEIETKTPSKEELSGKKTIEAPAALSGFDNEAQWGDLEHADDFGGWSGFPPPVLNGGALLEEVSQPETEYRSTSAESFDQSLPEDIQQSPLRPSTPHATSDIQNGELGIHLHGDQIARLKKLETEDSEHWEGRSQITSLGNSPGTLESELSDSNTTIRPDVALSEASTELEPSTAVDDDTSTRPSTSPSDASQPEIQSESPRTSFEEERIASKDTLATEDVPSTKDGLDAEQTADDEDDDFGDFEGEEEELTAEAGVEESPQLLKSPVSILFPESKASLDQPTRAENDVVYKEDKSIHSTVTFQPDLSLVGQLFPPPAPSENLPLVPDSTISSTSARKAWYRITRKQTMREFNSGNDDDNYVRITWMNSNVRLEVNKIVTRWSAEDRIAGPAVLGGKSAAAMFFWDQPATRSDQGASQRHARKRSSLSSSAGLSMSTSSTKHNVPALSDTSPVAQFNWSSSPVSPKPYSILDTDAVGRRTVRASTPSDPSPLSRKSTTVAKVQGHETKSASLDMARETPSKIFHKRASQSSSSPSTHSDTTIPPKPTAPSNKPDKLNSDHPRGLSQSASKEIPKATDAPVAEARPPTAQISSMDIDPWASLTRLDTTSQAPNTANIPQPDNDDWGEMVQSPVTPVLQPNFTPAKAKPLIQSLPSTIRTQMPFSPASSMPVLPLSATPALTSALPALAHPDPLATADFSIFETSTPPPPPPVPPCAPPSSSALPKHLRHPSIPVSFSPSYALPQPSSNHPASLPSPPHTSVSAAPSTTAVKRKEDEDAETIRRIVAVLPDLSYMLR